MNMELGGNLRIQKFQGSPKYLWSFSRNLPKFLKILVRLKKFYIYHFASEIPYYLNYYGSNVI